MKNPRITTWHDCEMLNSPQMEKRNFYCPSGLEIVYVAKLSKNTVTVRLAVHYSIQVLSRGLLLTGYPWAVPLQGYIHCCTVCCSMAAHGDPLCAWCP